MRATSATACFAAMLRPGPMATPQAQGALACAAAWKKDPLSGVIGT
jgi:hypothetical protein